MQKLLKLLTIPFICIAFLAFNNCSHPCKPKPIPVTPFPAVSGSAYLLTTNFANDTQIVQQGSRLLVVISTDSYFDAPQAQLKPDHIITATQMAQYVLTFASHYPLSTVYVRGYTDQMFPPYTQQTLSQQYADVISSYLWNAGIPLNHISGVGYGSAYPIGSLRSVRGMGFNRRVEIQIN